MSGIQIDVSEIVDAVKNELTKPNKIWDDYVPILEDDKFLTVYITEPINAASVYNEACHRIRTSDRPVKLILNTPGGFATSAFMFVAAMKACTQPIHGVIAGEVASAGTIITMYCDTVEVDDYAQFMVHNYSHGTQGSGAHVKDYVDFTDREFSKAVTEIYAGFLSEEEMIMISRQDKELWFSKDEVLERWERKQNTKESL